MRSLTLDLDHVDRMDGDDAQAAWWSHALRSALRHDRLDGVREALLNGAALDGEAYDEPVLHSLIDRRDLDLVRLALDRGANPNGPDGTDQRLTPLHRAIWSDQATMVRLLLERGADPTRTAFDGEASASTCAQARPMHLAAERAGPAVMRALLDADPAGVLIPDGWGRTPLHLTMLHPEARARDLAGRAHPVVALLLEHGADPDAIAGVRFRRSAPLHEAAYHGLGMVAQQLLDAGADPLVLNGMGETPMMVAQRRCALGMGVVLALERVLLRGDTPLGQGRAERGRL